MNREQAKELLPIIQAFAEGKTIEIRSNSKYNPGEWIETATPTFDIKSHEYRIKPGRTAHSMMLTSVGRKCRSINRSRG